MGLRKHELTQIIIMFEFDNNQKKKKNRNIHISHRGWTAVVGGKS